MAERYCLECEVIRGETVILRNFWKVIAHIWRVHMWGGPA